MTNGLSIECWNDSGTGYSEVIKKCTMNWFNACGAKNYGAYCTVGVNPEGIEFLFKKACPVTRELVRQMMQVGLELRFEGDNEKSSMKMYELNDAKNNFIEIGHDDLADEDTE